MKKFQYYQDELVNILMRHRFSVVADSQDEADEFVREKGLANSTNWHYDDMDGRVELIETNELLESQSEIAPEENDGIPTIEVITLDKKPVADNCGNRVYKSTCGLWREQAIKLMKERIDAPDEKVIAFADEFWDNLAPEVQNLFNFEKWLHGGDPLYESKKPELWAFLYPVEEMDRNVSDAEIVAAYEREDNNSREWPIEKLSPAGLAFKMNEEFFADSQYWVRFITV